MAAVKCQWETTAISPIRPWPASVWDVRVVVFPGREEVLICIFGLRGVTLQGVGTAQLELL